MLNRTNTITNVAYKDDPTILIWEIINEPRADDKQALYAWIDEMAGFVKSIDPHHLVSSGSEGTYGSDFYETNKSKNIDVASLHLYPELWGFSIDQANSYLNDHIRIARDRLKKPLYLGEFGLRSGIVDRPEIYRKWYDMMLGADVSGSLFWLLSGRQYGDAKVEGTPYPDYDGFSVYYPDSNDLCPIIQRHASAIATKRQSAMPKLLFRSQFPGTVAMTKN